jgi:hypothetical protein
MGPAVRQATAGGKRGAGRDFPSICASSSHWCSIIPELSQQWLDAFDGPRQPTRSSRLAPQKIINIAGTRQLLLMSKTGKFNILLQTMGAEV